jgi:hypothetical protein
MELRPTVELVEESTQTHQETLSDSEDDYEVEQCESRRQVTDRRRRAKRRCMSYYEETTQLFVN